MPNGFTSVEQLDDALSEPTANVVAAMLRLDGDILILGAGGKIGLSIARMAKRASERAGNRRRIVGVSRFSAPGERSRWQDQDIPTIQCDLLSPGAVGSLPAARNVLYLAGMKFGSNRDPSMTWALNAWLPGEVCQRFPDSRFVAFSTGNVYGVVDVSSGGSRESDKPAPIGEYAMSCLGRERIFEYFSRSQHIPVALVRLFYACEMRYGILLDLAQSVASGKAIDLSTGRANVVWQGDSNAQALQLFELAASPPFVINVTGPETLSVRETALALGQLLDKEPVFTGVETSTACLANTFLAQAAFGLPRIGADRLIQWTAGWVKRNGPTLEKPTHFEVRDGSY